MRRLHLSACWTLVCAVLLTACSDKHAPVTQSQIEPGLQQLWAQQLPDTQGHTHQLADYRGKTLVINFWATWCPPCRREMPGFSRLQDAFDQQLGRGKVQFIGLAIDDPEKVRVFASEHPVSYPLLIGNSQAASLSQQLGNQSQGLPYTLVIDPQGQVQARQLGGVTESDLRAVIERVVRQ